MSERVLAVVAEEGVRFTILAPGQLRAVRAPRRRRRPGRTSPGSRASPSARCAPTGPTGGATPGAPTWASTSSSTTAGWPTPWPSATRRARRSCAGRRTSAPTGRGPGGGHRRRDLRPPPPRCRAHDRARPSSSKRAEHGGRRRRGCVDLLDRRPPTHQAVVRTSAWSCAHGVGRWMHDCGCHTGGDPGWSQSWREPLAQRPRRAAPLGRRGDGPAGQPSSSATRGWPATPTSTCVVGARTFEDFAAQHVLQPDGRRRPPAPSSRPSATAC